MGYLKQISRMVNEQSNGFSGNKFREMTNISTPNAYLPDNYIKYEHCEGSAPHYRGYPCSLWLLFHTLTVSQFQTGFFLTLLTLLFTSLIFFCFR